MKLALISCTKLKKDTGCTAREMYQPSTLFQKASSYVEKQEYADWLILSAKYGLLQQNEQIEPYDITLLRMKAAERKLWAHRVMAQLQQMPDFPSLTHIDFYAGRTYREYLIPLLETNGITCHVPLQGLSIGQQLRFYNIQQGQQT